MSDDDDIRRIVESAGDEMPTHVGRDIAAAITAEVRHPGSVPPTDPGVPSRPVVLGAAPGTPGRRPRQRWVAVAGAAALAAAAIAAFVVVRHDDVDKAADDVPAPTVTLPPDGGSTTSTPATVPATLSSLPAGIDISSVSFPTAQSGWIIGNDSSGGGTVLLRTTDGGATWTKTALPVPGATVSDVVFADSSNGWIIGQTGDGTSALFATHDGRPSWVSVSLPHGDTAMTVAAGDGVVHVLAFDEATTSFTIYSAPVMSDLFSATAPVQIQPGAGGAFDASFALGGRGGVMVYDDRVLTGGARLVGGTWSVWQAPCDVSAAGDTTAYVASAYSSTDGATMVAACSTSSFVSPPYTARLEVSHDQGATFTETAPLPSSTLKDTSGASQPSLPSIGFVALPAPDVLVVGYARTDGTWAIVRSADDGASWTEVYHAHGEVQLGRSFTTGGAQPQMVVETGPGVGIISTDDGASWSPVGSSIVAA